MEIWMYEQAWNNPRRIDRPERFCAEYAAEEGHEHYILFFARLEMEEV